MTPLSVRGNLELGVAADVIVDFAAVGGLREPIIVRKWVRNRYGFALSSPRGIGLGTSVFCLLEPASDGTFRASVWPATSTASHQMAYELTIALERVAVRSTVAAAGAIEPSALTDPEPP